LDRKFVVLGGVGTIGRVVVRDLLASHRQNRVTLADFNLAKAQAYARSLRTGRVRAVFADASKPSVLAKVLRGHAVVINCTQHDFNLRVMQAALRAGIHYVDLGGLFHWTRRQLRLHRQFEDAGLTAVLGMGCAPGITNILAQVAADQMDGVEVVKIRVGSRELRKQPSGFFFPYSAQTIVEELTLKPWVFYRRRFRQVPPRTGWEPVNFPDPVGRAWVLRTRHSELATIPPSLRRKGIRFCDFKVGFERPFVREVMKRVRAGWTMEQFRPLTAPTGGADDVEVARVTVTGRRAGKRLGITIDCIARARPSWDASAGDIDTGCPPSIVAQMIADGRVTQRGVQPPERVVPSGDFLLEASRRGLQFQLRLEWRH
jgi:saccharopine dehydrogenase-like NADP-dependent oxidoreductase